METSQIHSRGRSAELPTKMQWLRVEGCYKTISVQVTLQGWRHPCITKRAHKQCGNSILKSSTATSSGSFHHCYITPKKIFDLAVWPLRACYSNCYMCSFFYCNVQRANHFFFEQIFKFFWVFPPVCPSSYCGLYLQSALLHARRYFAVMRPGLCLISRPRGAQHPS